MAEVKATSPKTSTEVCMNLPKVDGDMQDFVDRFGETVVVEAARTQFTTDARNKARQMLDRGVDPDEVKDLMENSWAPGVKLGPVAVDPVRALRAKLPSMSKEERDTLLGELLQAADDLEAQGVGE